MKIQESLILGIIQGITEFLPVSSSGHLLVVRQLMGLEPVPVLFDVILHISTLIVVIIVFKSKIGSILRTLLRWVRSASTEDDRENLKLCLMIVLATAVTAGIGLIFSQWENIFIGNIKIVSLLFMATAGILISSSFFKGDRGYLELGIVGALIIDFAQGLGVLPGVSRSGITISAALFCGLKRNKAGEFSFLIAIPAVLGALILKLDEAGSLAGRMDLITLGAGMAASFVVGFLSILLLLKLVHKGRLFFFSFYLIPLSLITFIFL